MFCPSSVFSILGSEARTVIKARKMYGFLEVGKKFADWIKYRIPQYSFTAGEDFFPILGKTSEIGEWPTIMRWAVCEIFADTKRIAIFPGATRPRRCPTKFPPILSRLCAKK
jgi:hypothetical protein